MKLACPHCSQRIEISSEVGESLRGQTGFDCPSCGGTVPLPSPKPDGSLGGLSPDQLLMRGIDTPAFTGGGAWEPPEPGELGDLIAGRYEVLHLLGRGGMGAVYQARDARLSRLVAIKILPRELVDHAAALARFEREARVLASLDHPNIVRVHDYGITSEGSPYFVMEYVDGRDLEGVRDQGELDLSGALRLVSEVCGALHYAHRKGVIHRDIKPANILVGEDGTAKVADFGLARIVGTASRPQADPRLTMTGEVMGTPSYMAPEQEAGRPADHRTDIYALGVMLYHLLTGTPPRGAWTPPSKRFQIDERLDEIVARALQEEPDARYQSAEGLRADLDSVRSQTDGQALPPGAEPEPLPSSFAGGGTTARKPPSAPGAARAPRRTEPSSDDLLTTTRGLNTTVMVLGVMALLTIGGLAIYLANRKTGDTYNSEQTVTTSVTNNTYFTQLINSGVASAEDLAAIETIRPYGEGLVGYSREILTGEQAEQLAGSVGAEVLPIPSDPQGATPPVIAWLRVGLVPLPANPMWVIQDGELRVLDGNRTVPPPSGANRFRTLLRWSTRAEEKPAARPDSPLMENKAPEIERPPEPAPPAADPPVPAKRDQPEPVPEAPALHRWTDRNGRTIEAEFLGLEGEAVVVRLRDTNFKIPFSKLTPESVALARNLRNPVSSDEP